MRRIIFLVLMLNVFFLSGESLSELPIDEWPRDRRIDKQVKRLAKKIEFHCKLVKGDYEAFGWDIVGVKLLYKLGEIVRNNPQKGIPSVYDIAMDRGRDRLLRNFMWEGLIINAKEKACIRAAGEFINNKTEDEYLRANVAELLGKAKDTSATPYLIQVMEDKSNPERVRWKAIRSIGSLHDVRGIPYLWKTLKNKKESKDIRAISARALGGMGKALKPNTDELIELFNNEEDGLVKDALICALGATGSKKVIKPLIDYVHRRKFLGDLVSSAILNIGGPEAKEALINLLSNQNEGVRFDAAKALIKMGDKSVIPEIEEVLGGFKNEHFRKVIQDSLEVLKKGKEQGR